MRKPLLIVLLFIGQFCAGQAFTFTQRFSDDSVGKYGFRGSSFYVSDTVRKTWMVGGKDLRGYTTRKVIEWIGKPTKIDSLKDGRVYLNYTIVNNVLYMYLRIKNNKVVAISDTVNETVLDYEGFSDGGAYGVVDFKPALTSLEIMTPVIEAKIKGKDTIRGQFGEDSLYDWNTTFIKYLKGHINYPGVEREAQITGTVYISFILGKDSSVTDVKLLKGVKGGPGLAKEVLRVMNNKFPKIPPHKEKGKAIKVMYAVGIRFVLG